jgi:hypothetical protein
MEIDNKKELKFIHITKTAGNSIEDCAKHKNINFGRFHQYEYGFWHEFFPTKNKDLKDKYDWFTVVRNPYDRIISEFHCKWGGIGNNLDEIDKYDINYFNNYIMLKIENRSESGDHYSEQYKYIDPEYNIHILKFENIDEEFNKLMNKYNLDITLDLVTNKSILKKFGVKDLSKHNINLINKVYDKDFEMFNYQKINIE